MSYGRIDDSTPWKAKVRDASWACRGVIATAAIPYCSGGETDGILLPAFERDLIYGRDGRRAFREAIERGFIHRAGELCERCLAALRRAGTEPPSEGWYLHDYLAHNPSKSDINRRRTEARERQRNVRAGARQPRLDWDQPDLSRVTSPTQPLGVEREVPRANDLTPIHAHASVGLSGDLAEQRDKAVAILAASPLGTDAISTPGGVENLMCAHPDLDVCRCAHIAASRGQQPGWRTRDAVRALELVMRDELERLAKLGGTERNQEAAEQWGNDLQDLMQGRLR